MLSVKHCMLAALTALFYFLLFFGSAASAVSSTTGIVDFGNGTSLTYREIGKLVSEQLGYVVLLDEDLLNLEIQGRFGKQHVDDFLRRILKNKNYSILFDEGRKEISIQTFGNKNTLYVFSPGDSRIENITGLSYREINNSIKKAREDLAGEHKIDQVSGLSYVKINATLTEQRVEINKADAIDSVTGEKYIEINRSLQRARNSLLDTDRVDPISGITYKKINDSLLQTRESIAMYNNQNSIDPISGRSYREINEAIMNQNSQYSNSY